MEPNSNNMSRNDRETGNAVKTSPLCLVSTLLCASASSSFFKEGGSSACQIHAQEAWLP